MAGELAEKIEDADDQAVMALHAAVSAMMERVVLEYASTQPGEELRAGEALDEVQGVFSVERGRVFDDEICELAEAVCVRAYDLRRCIAFVVERLLRAGEKATVSKVRELCRDGEIASVSDYALRGLIAVIERRIGEGLEV